MNRGVFQGSLMQQVAAGSPIGWSTNNLRPTNGEASPLLSEHQRQEHPQPWSQLLLGGLVGEEQKSENSGNCYRYSHGCTSNEIQAETGEGASWSQILPSMSCSILDFTNSKEERRLLPSDHCSECNSVETGAAMKKARVQGSSSSQFSTFKVRKEKIGDRITALHQMVSPFGKTDTASVLLEAIGYIRFLQSQIEALSFPYLNTVSEGTRLSLLNDNCMNKAGPAHQHDDDEPKKDLRSRGLCLVPISCTLHFGSDDEANYWAPSIGGAFR